MASRRSSSTGRPSARGTPPRDPVADALVVWRAVVAALEHAGYREVGPQYLRLSELLRQQRLHELLDDAADRPDRADRAEWADLVRTATAAVELLEPVVAAARRLQELPTAAELPRVPGGTRTTPTGERPAAPARRRARDASAQRSKTRRAVR